MERIYLDNAATSWPKPPGVVTAITEYLEQNGAPAGRGGYKEASRSQRIVQDCRRRLARLLNANHPDEIVFAFNGTDALNMAIHGLLRPGDHVVTTTLEHNSVLRPLRHWSQRQNASVTYLSPGADGRVGAESLKAALRPETRLAIVTHASNVTGVIQPVEEWGGAIRDTETLLLVDAAQTLGHHSVDVGRLGADLVAASTHKGVRGPLGTAMLYIGPRASPAIQPWRQGGTGTHSEDVDQPSELPERLESGNLNMIGLAGLGAALAALPTEGSSVLHSAKESELSQLLRQGLAAIGGCQIHDGVSDCANVNRTGVVSITIDGFEPQELATMLDVSFRIQTRAGLHCAPMAHRELGTIDTGGTLRFSLGPDNTEQQIVTAVDAVRSLVDL